MARRRLRPQGSLARLPRLHHSRATLFVGLLLTLGTVIPVFSQDGTGVSLPPGATAVWDMSKASRETTPTRERICINGLWRWQPARVSDEQAPATNWGFFKVPGCWPGISDYMQKDFQTLYPHPSWKDQRLGEVSAAWYERTISVPAEWSGRRIALSVQYLNSFAAVFIDGTKCGEIHFPGGEVDLSAQLREGGTRRLTLLVVALPLKGVLLSYTDSNAARQIQGKVERRGLCGDVFLVSTPTGPQIGEGRVETSVRKSEITFHASLEGLTPDGRYSLHARITRGGKIVREMTSRTFNARDLQAGQFTFSESWKPDALWDIHTPSNQFEATLSIANAEGRVLDTQFPVRFGFREFWIDGRDFYLNGSRIFLCAVPLDNAEVGAALASYGAARESLERLKSIGINFVYTHNYGCEPGSHLSFEEILRAADDVGMLVSLSQPHFSHYEWRSPDADQTNGYATHARFYAQVAGSHPSVVAYSMSHNATGYEEDMNPDMIDGLQDPRDSWSKKNSLLALRAEAIVRRLDASRIVYHHASGNLGSMHAINFYPNFVPSQELSNWFEHWATQGVKPVFTCEFGAPFTWDWTMYRGWYKGQRNFGSAQVPWEFCVAEWNAQFLGDRAYQISQAEAANLRWEAKQFRAGKVWHRWDYPNAVGSPIFDEQYPVFAAYLKDNWPAFRTWGVSALSPWEYGHYWKLREGVTRRRKELTVDWDALQRPGFSADYIDQQYERMDLALERADWVPTPAARALMRFNDPLLAWLAGKPERFTSKDHVFFAGETFEKQLIVVNNSRRTATCKTEWSLALPKRISGGKQFTVLTGEQERIPLRFVLPDNIPTGQYELDASILFNNGEIQKDSFAIHVLARPPAPRVRGRVGLFDPKGETAKLLSRMSVPCEQVDANADLSKFDILIVGKAALTTNGPAPDIARVRDGLKVLVFEQTATVLEKRFGFRVAEYGLRQVFPRVPDHPALSGISSEHLRDWRGAATLLPSRLDYTLRPRYGPTITWCDIPVPRLWRCGNQGNIASVLIEKPACGDFLPILDGGYSLQYSPLLEYREGSGLILFCQVDATGRTENDPVGDTLTANILRYVSDWKPTPRRTAVYVGDSAGKRHLESAGFQVGNWDGGKLSPEQVLIVGPGGAGELSSEKTSLAAWSKAGGKLLALGFDQADAEGVLQILVGFKTAEHISSFFDSSPAGSPFRGIGPADLHNRDPHDFPVVASGAAILGDGMLASAVDSNIVFCQVLPWQLDPNKQMNLKRTYRRVSFALTRLLCNVGVASTSPILERFHTRLNPATEEKRWLAGLYLDQPEEWDDPYRFFRW